MTDGQRQQVIRLRKEGCGYTAIAKERFRAEKMYRISLSVANSMLEKGVISKEEYSEMDALLLEKYRPVLGTLLAGKPLT